MRILLISIQWNSWSDNYYRRLQSWLKVYSTHEVDLHFIPKWYQFLPFLIPSYLRRHKELYGYDIIQTNIEFACYFVWLGGKLIGVLHHNIFDKEFQKYTSIAQKVYHYWILRYTTQKSLNVTDINVAVSNYTKQSYDATFVLRKPIVMIYNGIDLEKYHPIESIHLEKKDRPGIRLLFIGNQSKRKWWDIVVDTMKQLSLRKEWPRVELYYTWLRDSTSQKLEIRNMYCLWKLSEDALVEEYNRADYLFFPSRLEWFGYAVVESLACWTPVISHWWSSLDEILRWNMYNSLRVGAILLWQETKYIPMSTLDTKFEIARMIKEYEKIYSSVW